MGIAKSAERQLTQRGTGKVWSESYNDGAGPCMLIPFTGGAQQLIPRAALRSNNQLADCKTLAIIGRRARAAPLLSAEAKSNHAHRLQ